MKPIRSAFTKDHALFIPFIMAGHPHPEITIQAVLALEEAGADLIEIGVPFSDPIADGPINQKAGEIGLQYGVTLMKCLDMVKEVKALGCQVPIILFSYLNPIMAMGFQKFAKLAKEAGVDGIIAVDLPPEEGSEFFQIMNQYEIEPILLSSPTTDPHRLKLFADIEPGFIYVISRCGVTGTQQDVRDELEHNIATLRQSFPFIPLSVGFGISNEAQAAKVAKFADGVIVGSYLVKALAEYGIAHFKMLAKRLADAIHGCEMPS